MRSNRRISLLRAEPGFAKVTEKRPISLRKTAEMRGMQCFTLSGSKEYVIVDGVKAVVFRGIEPFLSQMDHSRHNNKEETKRKLENIGIPVPEGRAFEPHSLEKILSWWQGSGIHKAVLKPVALNKGKGVFPGLSSADAISKSYSQIAHHSVVIEEHIEGLECRFQVVGGRLVAATTRTPANVVGDGVNPISHLVYIKNMRRSMNRYYKNELIKIDEDAKSYLKEQGFHIESILPKGKMAYLKRVSNIAAGGDSEDITHRVHSDFIEIAERIWNAFPDRVLYGADVIAQDFSRPASDQKIAVIEVNNRPDIRQLHGAPLVGPGRDVPSKILDYVFMDAELRK